MPFARSFCLSILAGFALLSGTPARAADAPIVINLIALPSSTSANVYYAQEEGFFKDAGLDVHITSMTSSPAIIAALVSGSADIGFAAIGVGASARERGIPVYFIAPGQVYVPSASTSALVVPPDSTLRTPADFVGKTIGVTGIADLSFFTTESWIEKGGVAPASVKFAEIPFPQMAGALAQHRVDGVVMAEPFLTEDKDAKPIADVNGALSQHFMLNGWIAAEPWIRANPLAVARFQTALRRASLWGNTHRKEAGDVLIKYIKVDPDIASTMRMPQFATTLDPALLQPPIDAASKYSTHTPPMPASDVIWQAKP